MARQRKTVFALAVTCLLAGAGAAQAEERKAEKPLMDGKTLAGWHAVGDGKWTVEDGAFVGRANNEKLYGLLVSDPTFKDFTVRFKFQCPTGDSGFYIRTVIKPPEQAHGLQIQVGPPKSGTGKIYESYGRGWLVQPDHEAEKAFLKPDGWNEVVIAAHGPRVVIHVNGVKTCDITDEKSRPAGHFALQMHAGTKMEVKFKDIRIGP